MAEFYDLSNKLAGLVYSKTNGYKQDLNIILDQFNSINLESCHIDNPNKAILVINHLCNHVPPEEKSLAEKTCNLLTSLVGKKQIQLEGKTLSLAWTWCLECFKSDQNISVLKCLRALIDNGDDGKRLVHRENLTNEIRLALKQSVAEPSSGQELTLMCLKCVRSMVPSEKSKSTNMEKEKTARECLMLFEEYLYARRNSPDESIAGCSCVISSLKGLCTAIQVIDDVSDSANHLLGIAKGYMFYGSSKGCDVRQLYPSRITLPAESSSTNSKSSARKLRGKYDKKSKKVNVGRGGGAPSSEENEETTGFFDPSNPSQNRGLSRSFFERCGASDLSDSETEETAGKKKRLESKARLWALVLLATTTKKIGPKCFVCYLPAFLPDGLGDSNRTLIACAVEDPSPECRFEAVGILSTVISDSKPYFRLADRPTKSSFTSMACGIGHIIVLLHKSLTEALKSEKSVSILARLLKCASNLIRCTPYYKLEPGNITELSRAARPMLRHKDINVRISALNLFGCLVSIEPKIEEAKKIVLASPSDTKEESKAQNKEDAGVEKLWLFETCLENVKDEKKNSNTAFVIESLQVLGALVQNFFRETLLSFPKDIVYVLDYCSKKSEYPIKLYSGKLVEIVFNSLQYRLVSDEEDTRPSEAVVIELWDSLLKGPVTKLIQSHGEPMLKCTGCDCLANVGVQINGGQVATTVHNSFIFDLLERDKQILCIAYLFGCIRDDAPAVRSSAIRALAVFVLFPSLREDGLFLLDAIDAAVSASKDGHPNVRMQCAWLLGNISEAVVRNKADLIADECVIEENVLLRLLECCTEMACDAPKSRPGALRAIGNLLSIFDEKCIKRHGEPVEKGIDTLLKNAIEGSYMKARWNSCYALANLLRNPRVHHNQSLVTRILTSMIHLVEKDKNFKVRIGAGRVLAVPPNRSCYGELYRFVWTSVFRACENSKNMTDYSEFQHRDHLLDQLCLVACHLIGIMDPDDLICLKDNFLYHFESFGHHIKALTTGIVPEKSDAILKACDNITALKNYPSLNQEQKRTLDMLNDMFIDSDRPSDI